MTPNREQLLALAEENRMLRCALAPFAVFGDDIDGKGSRGAWIHSGLFQDDGVNDFTDSPDLVPLQPLPEDLEIIGINHEGCGGCYINSLSVDFFRNASVAMRDRYLPREEWREEAKKLRSLRAIAEGSANG